MSILMDSFIFINTGQLWSSSIASSQCMPPTLRRKCQMPGHRLFRDYLMSYFVVGYCAILTDRDRDRTDPTREAQSDDKPHRAGIAVATSKTPFIVKSKKIGMANVFQHLISEVRTRRPFLVLCDSTQTRSLHIWTILGIVCSNMAIPCAELVSKQEGLILRNFAKYCQ
jgi:hypothetical protein